MISIYCFVTVLIDSRQDNIKVYLSYTAKYFLLLTAKLLLVCLDQIYYQANKFEPQDTLRALFPVLEIVQGNKQVWGGTQGT